MEKKAMNRWRENEEKELIERLVSEIESGKVKTLGIYGHGASGKSTFAQELYQVLDAEKVNLLETDPYITSGTTFSST